MGYEGALGRWGVGKKEDEPKLTELDVLKDCWRKDQGLLYFSCCIKRKRRKRCDVQ